MKKVIALSSIAASIFLALGSASAEEYVTLSNYGDTVELKAGETALVVSASDKLVLQYDKKTYPVRSSQFRLAASTEDSHHHYRVNTRKKHFTPTWKAPFPLAGPCKIKLMTPGVVGMRLVGGEE